ncbi:RHS repeat-associated core domain-containing protein [Entomospira entomophila]|uniref:RHS repeat-associated core domain-containing protein n=1 Tax=Entomospira entomophila TaxID=2719988 RepID=A0A968G9F9_9SPIO|nr:RHS repeat-associated core domain-containing protein [Entomospira entomophilus]NIZ41028.1 RHS repeat-associated core domain-containing protein [Entomospira entomophilus]WDI35240.1 RHS repeat-associated core domain-containing protein [Entomospira entomophilus]
MISDYQGKEFKYVEYTPYGEEWFSETSNLNSGAVGPDGLEYGFTDHLHDEETGLIYANARYLDPKTSRWMSSDPAMAEYLSTSKDAPAGGVFNSRNLQTYHYAGNNPIKYTDPTGRYDTTYFTSPEYLERQEQQNAILLAQKEKRRHESAMKHLAKMEENHKKEDPFYIKAVRFFGKIPTSYKDFLEWGLLQPYDNKIGTINSSIRIKEQELAKANAAYEANPTEVNKLKIKNLNEELGYLNRQRKQVSDDRTKLLNLAERDYAMADELDEKANNAQQQLDARRSANPEGDFSSDEEMIAWLREKAQQIRDNILDVQGELVK